MSEQSNTTTAPKEKAPSKVKSFFRALRGKLPKWKNFSKKKKILTIILVVVILLVLNVVRGMFSGNNNAALLTYTTEAVTRCDITNSLTGSGTLAAADSYSVTTLLEGEVLSANFEEGDIVTKDTALYEIDSSKVTTSLGKSELSLSQAQTSYNNKLKDLENLTPSAPCAGKVVSINVKVGDDVSVGQTIATVRNDSVMRLILPFPASEAAAISVGSSATATLDGSFDTLAGTVTEVSGVDIIQTGNVVVRNVTIEVNNPGAISTSQVATAVVGSASCAASGTFAYKDEKVITAKVSGKVSSIYVSEGTAVSKGQSLLLLSSDSLEEEVQSAANALHSAELDMNSQHDTLDNYTITSPIEGTIVDKTYKAGDTVASGKTLCTIYDLSYLTLTMSIDELDISQLSVGQTVSITADAVEGSTYEGVITKVSVAGTTTNGVTSYPVTVRIDKTDGLLPGMNVDAKIVLEHSTDVLMVPAEAISRGNVVLVTQDSPSAVNAVADMEAPEGYVYVNVTVGISDDNNVEITAGLQEGDTIAYIESLPTAIDAYTMMMEEDEQSAPEGGPSDGGSSGGGPDGGGTSGGY